MPHATGLLEGGADEADEADDILISQVLGSGDPYRLGNGLDLGEEPQPGEKADDAIDFGDLSDNDLADDEDGHDARNLQGEQLHHLHSVPDFSKSFTQDGDLSVLPTENNLEDTDMDDLFGEDSSAPIDGSGDVAQIEVGLDDPDKIFGDEDTPFHSDHISRPISHQPDPYGQRACSQDLREPTSTPLSREQQIQMELFQMSRPSQETLPAPPENQEELLASLWPKFKRDTVPKFMELLPPKKARYIGKSPPKPPRSIFPTKISLELAPDQEKSFKLWPVPNKKTPEEYEQSGIITVKQDYDDGDAANDDVDMDSDFDCNLVGGISWQDLQIACGDWNNLSLEQSLDSEEICSFFPGEAPRVSNFDKAAETEGRPTKACHIHAY